MLIGSENPSYVHVLIWMTSWPPWFLNFVSRVVQLVAQNCHVDIQIFGVKFRRFILQTVHIAVYFLTRAVFPRQRRTGRWRSFLAARVHKVICGYRFSVGRLERADSGLRIVELLLLETLDLFPWIIECQPAWLIHSCDRERTEAQGKDDFAAGFKNLARYRSVNNFVERSK